MGRGRRGGVSSKGSGAESDEPVEMTDAFLDRSARECLRSWPGEGACSTLSIIWWWREEDRKRREGRTCTAQANEGPDFDSDSN